MKKQILVGIVCLAASFSGCEKKAEVKPELPPTPTPAPSQTPTPTPPLVATPSPTPQARLAPEGVLYVVSAFSLTTEEGVHGFPPGKKVKILREEGDSWVVSDGSIEAKAAKTSFTNDLDIADRIISKAVAEQKKSEQSAVQSTAESKTNDLVLQRQRGLSVINTNISRAKAGLSAIDEQIKALKAEIESLRSKYGSYSPKEGWVMNRSWANSPTKQHDEMEIATLQAKRAQIAADLSKFEQNLKEVAAAK